MKFNVEDRVVAKYGVTFEGLDLSDLVGVVRDVSSYTIVYFPEYDLFAKLFSYEIEHYPRVGDLLWN